MWFCRMRICRTSRGLTSYAAAMATSNALSDCVMPAVTSRKRASERRANSRLSCQIKLTAELESGNLRYIRYDGIEMIRAVSFIVRDKNWGTYDPAISNLAVSETRDGFTVTYDAVTRDAAQQLRYSAVITGDAAGNRLLDESSVGGALFIEAACHGSVGQTTDRTALVKHDQT